MQAGTEAVYQITCTTAQDSQQLASKLQEAGNLKREKVCCPNLALRCRHLLLSWLYLLQRIVPLTNCTLASAEAAAERVCLENGHRQRRAVFPLLWHAHAPAKHAARSDQNRHLLRRHPRESC